MAPHRFARDSVVTTMTRVVALVCTAAIACSSHGDGGDKAAPPPIPRATQALPADDVRDYEGLVRKLYSDEPDYERRWPVEFKVRVVEGLLQDLAHAAFDLGDQMGSPYFADHVELGWGTPGTEETIIDGYRVTAFAAEAPRARTATEIRDLFRDLLGKFRFIDRAVFKPKGAHEIDGGGLEATVAIDLAGRETAGSWRHDSGSAEVQFHKIGTHWQITRFAVGHYEMQRANELAFADVTDQWLAGVSPAVRSMLRKRSASDEMHRMLLDDKHPTPPALDHLLPLAMDAHPGVVVVDIDGDGFDDLFVWDVQGPSVLLHNDGGHGFSDRTEQYGLGLTGVNAAAFADLDGDGCARRRDRPVVRPLRDPLGATVDSGRARVVASSCRRRSRRCRLPISMVTVASTSTSRRPRTISTST